MNVPEAFRGGTVQLATERADEGAEVGEVVALGPWAGAVVSRSGR